MIYFIAFSGGLMLGIGLLHIFPEAQELNPRAYVYFTIAFVVFYLLEHHLPFHAEHEQMLHDTPHLPCSHNHSCANANPMGMVAFFGMSLHSMIDGMIIGTGFEVDTRVGLLSAIAVVAHKIPAGAAIFSILLHYGWPRRIGHPLYRRGRLRHAGRRDSDLRPDPHGAAVSAGHTDGGGGRLLRLYRRLRPDSRIPSRPRLEGKRLAGRRDSHGRRGRLARGVRQSKTLTEGAIRPPQA